MTPPRLTSQPLPEYSFVPGHFPHPHSDPAGHQFGRDLPSGAVDPDRWQDDGAYLLGIDLFNHGYYWEAHEVWEHAWNAAGRRGTTAAFIKALIQLAVAGVKIRQKMTESAVAHAARALQLLRDVRAATATDRYMGLPLDCVTQHAAHIAEQPPAATCPLPAVEVLFPFALLPDDGLASAGGTPNQARE